VLIFPTRVRRWRYQLLALAALCALGASSYAAAGAAGPRAHAALDPCCGVSKGKIFLNRGAVDSRAIKDGAIQLADLAPSVQDRLNPAKASSARAVARAAASPCCTVTGGKIFLNKGAVGTAAFKAGSIGLSQLSPALRARLNVLPISTRARASAVAHAALEPCCGKSGGKIYLNPDSVGARELTARTIQAADLSPELRARLNPAPPGGPCCTVTGGKIFLKAKSVASPQVKDASIALAALSPSLRARLNPATASSARARAHAAADPCCGVRNGKIYLNNKSVGARELKDGTIDAADLSASVQARLNPPPASAAARAVAHAAADPCCTLTGGKIYLKAKSVGATEIKNGTIQLIDLSPEIRARLKPPS
jgi:hypothetical protein